MSQSKGYLRDNSIWRRDDPQRASTMTRQTIAASTGAKGCSPDWSGSSRIPLLKERRVGRIRVGTGRPPSAQRMPQYLTTTRFRQVLFTNMWRLQSRYLAMEHPGLYPHQGMM